MRKLCLFVSMLTALVLPQRSYGLFSPSFNLDASTWHASHIVVATTGKSIGTGVTVLESWKGDLRQGDHLILPSMARFRSEEMLEISTGIFGGRENETPSYVSGKCVLLFLVKRGRMESNRFDDREIGIWNPAVEWGGLLVSMMWLEGGSAYAYAQRMNPGPTSLFSWDMTEVAVKNRVEAILRVQGEFRGALAQPDPEKMRAIVLPLRESAPEFTRKILVELGEAGPKALPTLRALLKAGTLKSDEYGIVTAMAKAGGKSVGPELVDVLRQEMDYWRTFGPRLQPGWWNGTGIEWAEVERHRNRYGVLLSALEAVKSIQFEPARPIVEETAAYWRSLPQLAEVRQLPDTADAVFTPSPDDANRAFEVAAIAIGPVADDSVPIAPEPARSTSYFAWAAGIATIVLLAICLFCSKRVHGDRSRTPGLPESGITVSRHIQ
jgi:hypothetical protein